MTLEKLQQTVDTWIREHGGYWGKFEILARLTEELGEVAATLQRSEGLRPRKVEANLDDEVGDLLFTLAAFANANGLSLEAAFGRVLEKYNLRDSSAWKEQRGT
jgi:NTP pyrophosphatase (non-canonical NTP hydrolase)